VTVYTSQDVILHESVDFGSTLVCEIWLLLNHNLNFCQNTVVTVCTSPAEIWNGTPQVHSCVSSVFSIFGPLYSTSLFLLFPSPFFSQCYFLLFLLSPLFPFCLPSRCLSFFHAPSFHSLLLSSTVLFSHVFPFIFLLFFFSFPPLFHLYFFPFSFSLSLLEGVGLIWPQCWFFAAALRCLFFLGIYKRCGIGMLLLITDCAERGAFVHL